MVSAESGFGHEPLAKLPDVSDMAQCPHSRSGTLRLWFQLNQVAQFSRISWGTLLNFSAAEICATLVLKAADLLRRCPSDERVQDEPKVSADAARALKEERKSCGQKQRPSIASYILESLRRTRWPSTSAEKIARWSAGGCAVIRASHLSMTERSDRP